MKLLKKCRFYRVLPFVVVLMPLNVLLSAHTDIHKERILRVLEVMDELYRPHFQENNKLLEMTLRWEEDGVNAHATRDMEDNPQVIVPGGLARHPLLTEDALLLIVCHELGHFLGGAPKSLMRNRGQLSWSSAEGQADYFATNKCFKKLLHYQRQNEEVVFDLSASNNSTQIFTLQDHLDVESLCSSSECKKVFYAALSAAKVFAAVKWESRTPSLSSHDPKVVNKTFLGHSSAQCRLDTFRAGWFCPTDFNDSFSDKDPRQGACIANSDVLKSAFKRPSCWYHP